MSNTIPSNCLQDATSIEISNPATTNFSRSQWVRAAVLGANDGIISISSLMIGIGATNQSPRPMLIAGFAGLIAGTFSMAIGEFVAVYAQYDIESEQLKRDFSLWKKGLPSPLKAAVASATTFASGAALPLLAGGFIGSWVIRVAVVATVSTIGLAIFGSIGAIIGGAPVGRAVFRILVGGWIAMLVTFGVLRLSNFAFNDNVSNRPM